MNRENYKIKEIREFKEIPYYEFAHSLNENIVRSSNRREISKLRFIIKKIFNFTFSTLAYNCPVNSWRVKLHKLRGVNIEENVFIGLRVTIDNAYPEYIYLKANSIVSGNNILLAHSNPYKHFNKTLLSYVAPIVIGEGSWLGSGSMVFPGVKIGKYSVISGGSVVTKDVEDQKIVAGNPAIEIGKVRL